MVRPIHIYSVSPTFPPQLARLQELAYNLWWTWNPEAADLFRRLDRELWERSNHNPAYLLGSIQQQRLAEASQDQGFLTHLSHVLERFDAYMARTQAADLYAGVKGPIAYVCMEFGLTECLPIYSGGMGVMAGDYLKSASDLGLPIVGLTLLYQEGYFQQYLNPDGWQQEYYPTNDFFTMPVTLVQNPDGTPLTVQVILAGQAVTIQVWQVQVGRVLIYMLDTNLPTNDPANRDITDRLYGGDADMRLRQEIVLGIGGMRALEALGLRPTVVHINEGHAAFFGLERIRLLMEENHLSFAEAREIVAASSVFTTHTPVAAGIDVFSPDLIGRYFADYAQSLGLSFKEFLGLGRYDPNNDQEPFNMAILAMRLAHHINAVSQIHGQVARSMWQNLWPGVPKEEVPIRAINNGIHPCSWVAPDLADLYDRYLGTRWRIDPPDQNAWEDVDQIPDEELWHAHETQRERLVYFLRQCLKEQLAAKGALPSEIEAADGYLNPYALTIVFARRFAAYKRPTLLFHDPDRLARLISDPTRPVQIIYAGKAHPRDNDGKELIRYIIHQARRPELVGRVIFLENYDLNCARYLVQGADVWLNNPRRPLEASGTSGMKAVINGVLNVSILDGWWADAYRPEVGWAIGRGEEYEDLAYQDMVEANALYDLLEKEVIPAFYDRGRNGVPRKWVARMKAALKYLCPTFNTNRMVHDYTVSFYRPAADRYVLLTSDGQAKARSLVAWKERLRQEWPHIRVVDVRSEPACELRVGGGMPVRARVHLGNLTPADVLVQIYEGPLNSSQEIVHDQVINMEVKAPLSDGDYEYAASVPCNASGRRGYALRILPNHPDLSDPFEPRLIFWA